MGKKKASHLVPVKKMITRNGKTYETTVLVNPNKKDTVSSKKTTIPLEDWAKIKTLDDFEKARKHIYKYDDVARKDILKEEFVDFLERSGVYWERSDDFAIDYMRAMTKAKMMIKEERFVADDINIDSPKPAQPYKRVPKAEARKMMQQYSKIMQVIVKQSDGEYKDVDAYLEETLELYNISWQKSEHKGVNHMRMMMAMREAIQEGRKTPLSHQMEGNPDYEKYQNFLKEQETKKNGGFDLSTLAGVTAYVKRGVEVQPWKSPNNLVEFKTEDGVLGRYRLYKGDVHFNKKDIIGMYPKQPNEKKFKNKENFKKKHAEWKKEYNIWYEKYTDVMKRSEKLVKEMLDREPLFKTKDEVKNWAKSIGVDITDEAINKTDMRCWNDVAPALEEMLERFPQLRTFTFKNINTGKMETVPLKIVFKEDDGGTFMYGGIGRLTLTTMMKDYEETLTSMCRGMCMGFNQCGDGTFKTIVRHECGHVLETMLLQNNFGFTFHGTGKANCTYNTTVKDGNYLFGAVYQEYVKRLQHIGKLDGHSNYSKKNEREVFAESFTALMSGQHNKFAEGMKEMLTEYKFMKDDYME